MRAFGLMAIAAIGLLASTPAMAGDLDFKLNNSTGYDIGAVHISPAGSDQWGEVKMGDNALDDGTSVEISFTGDPESCKWDLKVDWAEEYPSTVWQGVNLCNVSDITLHYNRETDETTAELK